ncbi:unnamed protein product, partial [Discosporangium mesarthrocarpum]
MVGAYLHDKEGMLDVLLLNCHLHGTNQYSVSESFFDEIRMQQLDVATVAVDRFFSTAPSSSSRALDPSRMCIFGDLNFRTEALNSPEDKLRGGADFQAVVKEAESCDASRLLNLYEKSDRLYPLLSDRSPAGPESSGCCHQGFSASASARPPKKKSQELRKEARGMHMGGLLSGCSDGLEEALRMGRVVPPTFTFQAVSMMKATPTPPNRRTYKDKRTPSWTDRVLWRGFDPLGQPDFSSVPEVVTSDHEPVYCLLCMP